MINEIIIANTTLSVSEKLEIKNTKKIFLNSLEKSTRMKSKTRLFWDKFGILIDKNKNDVEFIMKSNVSWPADNKMTAAEHNNDIKAVDEGYYGIIFKSLWEKHNKSTSTLDDLIKINIYTPKEVVSVLNLTNKLKTIKLSYKFNDKSNDIIKKQLKSFTTNIQNSFAKYFFKNLRTNFRGAPETIKISETIKIFEIKTGTTKYTEKEFTFKELGNILVNKFKIKNRSIDNFMDYYNLWLKDDGDSFEHDFTKKPRKQNEQILSQIDNVIKILKSDNVNLKKLQEKSKEIKLIILGLQATEAGGKPNTIGKVKSLSHVATHAQAVTQAQAQALATAQAQAQALAQAQAQKLAEDALARQRAAVAALGRGI